MKIKLSIAAGLLSLACNANAAIYAASNVVEGTNRDVLFQNAGPIGTAPLLNGGIVSLGYFIGGAPSSDINLIATTISNFTMQTFALTGSFSVDLDGSFAGYVQGAEVNRPINQLDSPLLGLPVYIFVGNAATLAGSTAWALTQVSTIAADIPNEQLYTGVPSAGTVPVLGTIGTFTGAVNSVSLPYTTLQLQVIPEPSAALLGAIGALGLLRRRRN